MPWCVELPGNAPYCFGDADDLPTWSSKAQRSPLIEAGKYTLDDQVSPGLQVHGEGGPQALGNFLLVWVVTHTILHS